MKSCAFLTSPNVLFTYTEHLVPYETTYIYNERHSDFRKITCLIKV